jgi:hypothetical protein
VQQELALLPVAAACYEKIQGSLGRMAQLLQLYHQARRHQQVDVDDDTNTKTIQQQPRLHLPQPLLQG